MVRRILMVMFVLLAVGSFVHVEESKAQSDKGNDNKPTVVTRRNAVPETKSEASIPNLQIVTYSDGSEGVEGSMNFTDTNASEYTLVYSYTVDLKKGSYMAQKNEKKSKKNAQAKNISGYSSGIVGLRTVEVAVVTYDPILLEVARQYSQLQWSVGGGTVGWYSTSHSCSAANPTMILNTHWFVANCNKLPWTNTSKTAVGNTVNSAFWNTDFHDPALRTDVGANSTIEGRGDLTYGVTWGHRKSGENSAILSGNLLVNQR